MAASPTDPPVPTLADVAQLANVSTATVSRCLNSPDQVVAETRDRVMRAVAELGYAPNFGARALAAKHTNTVGAVIPTMENAVFARGIQAFQEELVRHGKTLLIASSAYKSDLEEEQVRALVARGADGLLLIGYDRNPDLYAFLAKRAVPTLVAWSYVEGSDQPAIGFDNRAAMAELARLVIGRGHRNIACISALIASNDRARGRVEGIRLAMDEAGLDGAGLPLVETPYAIENGEAAFREVMATAPDTTVVMCVNDVLAIGALRAAREMGLSVPDDVSITGFDDIEIAMLAEPALTTVHVPHREMGRRAATMLIAMLRDNEKPESVKLPTDIRLRQSLGSV
ncbi:LacI family DNA-binding transcriptional regulator [Ponticoccus sp. SC2-23]|nr:LacI family DNA-binding transcriptional regulator [Ponticoccus sp. SC6-9]MBM1223073.1 LacI family DNA-binding transcriptional regulator [Ponticoccus sp. SC6-15]MBM1229668.1 LacI family DNA-binding transcriptional regulator [Ponticoccus sp. SC6-38]MBM1232039.1 LacI family DNA-binding transcriptional regulator [Ponticoccus sp. SC6-45]MBM1238011.1 LacI family DNA-binding transcriptional regulator [Ponticoccus sp. SC6-49]MBM1241050.1 LacI family DNA-binding transcriptional regulator [Ponticoccu